MALWRGPEGTGVSDQSDLPDYLSLENDSLLWTHEIQGGGVPVVAGGRAYQFGYYGVEDDLEEALVCFDAATGKVLWERKHSDFISDIVYNRYGVGAHVSILLVVMFIFRLALGYLSAMIQTEINCGNAP